jgi:hypothetical protein
MQCAVPEIWPVSSEGVTFRRDVGGDPSPRQSKSFLSTFLKSFINLHTFQFSLFSVYIPFFLPEHWIFLDSLEFGFGALLKMKNQLFSMEIRTSL